MRISGGDARGIRLKAPKGARPTSERVRQAVFSSIAARLPDARVLDLYAGSGAYGLEAISRGAASAVFVDADAQATSLCTQNARATGFADRVRVRRTSVERYLRRDARRDGPFDLAFVDPPYAKDARLDPLVDALADGALVICEGRWRSDRPPDVRGLVVEADRRYGDTRIVMLARGPSEQAAPNGAI